MLINKIDKSYETRSDVANINWLGEEWYLVPDNSLLAAKVKKFFPRFDFVLDQSGNLIDIEEIPYTEKELKQQEVDEIDAELNEIDKSTGLTRTMEDIITHTGIYLLMYDGTKEIIEKKEALRDKRNKLIKEMGGM